MVAAAAVVAVLAGALAEAAHMQNSKARGAAGDTTKDQRRGFSASSSDFRPWSVEDAPVSRVAVDTPSHHRNHHTDYNHRKPSRQN